MQDIEEVETTDEVVEDEVETTDEVETEEETTDEVETEEETTDETVPVYYNGKLIVSEIVESELEGKKFFSFTVESGEGFKLGQEEFDTQVKVVSE